ncbi:MAG TPA: CPBP family intramembrane glutamic endopeptidase [Candidatus Acidoferrum sp.]|nr:CPBP family intramembrane glutamic endopeptidase [Candidatus Acidoferrum sp.]
MNSSISKRSADWPTTWPNGSFRPVPTILLVAVVIAPIVAFGIYQGVVSASVHIDQRLLGDPLIVITSLALTLVAEGALALLVIALLPRISRLSLRELGYRRPASRDLLVAFVGSLAMAIVANGGASLLQAILHTSQDQQAVAMLRQLHDPRLLAAFALFACVLAPLMEETIFRVFLFNATRRYWGFWAGAIVSGACFGLAHGDPIAALPLALGGVVLAFVYYRTNNAFASMITHGLFNSYTILALILAPQLAK